MRTRRIRSIIIAGIILSIGSCKTETIQTIPDFNMILPDNVSVFNSKEIPYGKTIVLIQFDPTCRECQIETENILANMNKYRGINFYLITRHPYDEMMVFHDHLRLDTCINLKIGIDTSGSIPKAYQYRSTPLTLIYNSNKELTAVIRGRAKTKQLDSLLVHSQTKIQ